MPFQSTHSITFAQVSVKLSGDSEKQAVNEGMTNHGTQHFIQISTPEILDKWKHLGKTVEQLVPQISKLLAFFFAALA